MRKLLRIFQIILALYLGGGNSQAQQVVDYDGNIYDTVIIGSQSWLKQNLKVTHYRNGVPIPNVTDSIDWRNLTTGARCYYANDSAGFDSVYGALYNWYAVNDNNELCPEGWHVPADAEWTTLANFLGGEMVAGGKMKEAGTAHWLAPNAGATNSSGFTGLPGGMRNMDPNFAYLYENGLWWATTQYNQTSAWSRYLWYMYAGIDRNPTPKYAGFSIRCIKDINTGTQNVLPEFRIRLYPNPAHDHITIGCPETSSFSMTLYNHTGMLLLERKLTGGENIIDIGSLAGGLYVIVLSENNKIITRVFVKE